MRIRQEGLLFSLFWALPPTISPFTVSPLAESIQEVIPYLCSSITVALASGREWKEENNKYVSHSQDP